MKLLPGLAICVFMYACAPSNGAHVSEVKVPVESGTWSRPSDRDSLVIYVVPKTMPSYNVNILATKKQMEIHVLATGRLDPGPRADTVGQTIEVDEVPSGIYTLIDDADGRVLGQIDTSKVQGAF